MTFLAPWWLVGLPLVPALLLWGLLAPRGRPVTVGSLLLWRRALGKGAAGRPSARLRLKDPVLWLDAAAVALILLACARPAVRTAKPLEPVAAIVWDRTASMGSKTEGTHGVRWREARTMVRDVLGALPDAPVRLVSVPGPDGAVVARTVPLRQVLDAFDPLTACCLAEDDAWQVAAEEAAAVPDRPVLLVTDAARPDAVPPNLHVLAPGAEPANAGLAAVTARVEDNRWWLLVRARATPAAPEAVGLAVSTGDTTLAERSTFVAPGGTGETVLGFDGSPPARLHVTLTGPADAFPPDDEAYLSPAAGPARRRIRLIGEAPTAVRRALQVLSGAEVIEHPAGQAVPGDETDLVVAYREPLPAGWAGPAVIVLPTEAVGPVRPGAGTVSADWTVAPGHPLADAFYLAPPRLTAAPRYQLYARARLLLGTQEAPLMVTWETSGARRLAVLFDLDKAATDWPERAGFPVFWSRAVDYLVPGGVRPLDLVTHRPREPVASLGRPAPGRVGFVETKSGPVGVSFIGTDEGFESGPGRDDSAEAIGAVRDSIRARREAALTPAWPLVASLALVALLARAWAAR